METNRLLAYGLLVYFIGWWLLARARARVPPNDNGPRRPGAPTNIVFTLLV